MPIPKCGIRGFEPKASARKLMKWIAIEDLENSRGKNKSSVGPDGNRSSYEFSFSDLQKGPTSLFRPSAKTPSSAACLV